MLLPCVRVGWAAAHAEVWRSAEVVRVAGHTPGHERTQPEAKVPGVEAQTPGSPGLYWSLLGLLSWKTPSCGLWVTCEPAQG